VRFSPRIQTVPVTLEVKTSVPVGVSTLVPGSFAFSYQAGGAIPAPVALSVNGGAGQIFSVTAGNTGWLTVNPLSGVAPAALSVAINPAGLDSGTYSGVIIVEANTGLGVTSQNVVVTLTVADASPPANLRIGATIESHK
jgi:hypothetical protein